MTDVLPPARRVLVKPPVRHRGHYSLLPWLLSVTAVAAALPWLFRVPSHLVAFLLACQLIQCAHGAMRAIMSGHRLLSAVFWTFCLCYIAVPAIYQVSTGQAAWRDLYIYSNQERLLKTLIVTNVAFALYALGSAGRPRGDSFPSARIRRDMVRFRSHSPRPIADQAPRQQRSYLRPRAASTVKAALSGTLVPLLYCGVAVLLLPLVIQASGGIGGLFTSRTERSEALAAQGIGQPQSGGAAVALVVILPGALALAATYVLLLRWRTGHRTAPFLITTASVLMFLYTNPFVNTRYISSVALISVLFLLVQPRTRKALGVVVVTLVIGVLGIYPLANAFRGSAAPTAEVSLAAEDFDGFQQMVNTMQFVEEHGHTWGAHLSSAVLFVVPRSVWPSKAEPASIPVAENRGYEFTNLSLPFPGELYLEFGVFGVAAGMFLWGRGWRQLDEAWSAGTDSLAARMVPYFAIAQLGVLRGPVLSQYPIYASTTMLLLFALYLQPFRSRPGALPPTRGTATILHDDAARVT